MREEPPQGCPVGGWRDTRFARRGPRTYTGSMSACRKIMLPLLLSAALLVPAAPACTTLLRSVTGAVSLSDHESVLSDDVVVVPMDDTNRHLAVSVTFGDDPRPLRFNLDTGASIALTLDLELVERLELPSIGTTRNGDSSGRSERTLLLHRVDSVRLGGAEFTDVVALGDDYRWIAGAGEERVWGLLGWLLFKDLLLTIDHGDDRIRLERGSLADESGPHVVPDLGQAGPVIAIDVGGQTLEVLIDTGTRDALLLPGADKQRFRHCGEVVRAGSAQTVNNVLPVWAGELEGDVIVAGRRFPAVQAIYVEGFDRPLIGHGLLGEARLTFDQRARRIRFDFGED